MEIRQLTETLSVCGQIRVEDIPNLADQGFRTLICNRPDREDIFQQPYAEIAAAAHDGGMAAHYLPVAPGGLTPELIAAFGDIIEGAEKPVLAYCRTGTRSTMLWQHAQDAGHKVAG
jgi:sulfide:quinone oxidoreductase